MIFYFFLAYQPCAVRLSVRILVKNTLESEFGSNTFWILALTVFFSHKKLAPAPTNEHADYLF